VVEKIINFLPLKYRLFATEAVIAKAKELFQASFDRLESVALKAIVEHGEK